MNKKIIVLLALTLGIFPISAQEDTTEAYKEAIRNALAEFSSGNSEPFFALFDERYLMSQGTPTLEETTRADTQYFVNALLAAMPNLQITPELTIAQDDQVAVALSVSGTFTQPFTFEPFSTESFPPTNQTVTWTQLDFLRFNETGLITENWSFGDATVLFAQLGVEPSPESETTGTAIEAPIGYKSLDPDAMAATLNSNNEARNLQLFEEQVALSLGVFSQYYIDPYIAWNNGEASFVTAEREQAEGAFLYVIKQAMPDVAIEPDVLIAEGDWVAGVLRITGTFTNDVDFFGTPLSHTSEQIAWMVGFIDRYNADGKIVEVWIEVDETPLLQGLGLMPAFGE